jgi:ribosome modulation factor
MSRGPFKESAMKSAKSLGIQSTSSGSTFSRAQNTGSHHGPLRPIRGAHKTIAKERAAKVDTSATGFLRNRTVRNECTRKLYTDAVAKFKLFAVTLGAMLMCISDVDSALEKYFESLFIQGSSQYVASCTLCGWAFLNPSMSTKPRHHFPLAKAALKGWKNLEPGGSKDPCPYEVALMIASWFLDKGLVLMAAFVVLCFDTYVRPGVMSLLKRSKQSADTSAACARRL